MRRSPIVLSLLAAAPLGAQPSVPTLVLNLETSVAARMDLSRRMTMPVTVAGDGPYQFVVDTGSDRSIDFAQRKVRFLLPDEA